MNSYLTINILLCAYATFFIDPSVGIIQVDPVLIVNNPVVNRYSLGFTGFITGSGVSKSYGRYQLSFDEKPP